MNFKALLGLLLLATQLNAAVRHDGAEVGEWTMDYDAALKLAKKENLPVMLNFTGSDWCHWCIQIEHKVFSQPAWQKFASSNIVLVTLDFPRRSKTVPDKYVTRNDQLAAKFGVQGYPTLMILDSDGKTLLGKMGASRDMSPESFIKQFKHTTRFSQRGIEEFAKKNPEKAKALRAAAKKFRDSIKTLEAFIDQNPPRTEENLKKFQAMQERLQDAYTALQKF